MFAELASQLDPHTAALICVIVVLVGLVVGLAKLIMSRRDGRKAETVPARCEELERRLSEAEATCRRCLSNGGPFIRRGEFQAWREGMEREYERISRGLERASEALARARRGKGLDRES